MKYQAALKIMGLSFVLIWPVVMVSCSCNESDAPGDSDADTPADPDIDPDTAETVPDGEVDADDVDVDADAGEDPADVPYDGEEEPAQIRVTVSDLTFRGPSGGEINALAADPSDPDRIYAIVDKTLFVSTDEGTSWSELPAGDGSSYSIEVLDDGTLFVGGFPFVYRSDDKGETWEDISYDIGLGHVTALEYRAAGEPKLWAGLDGAPAGEPAVWSLTPGETTWTSHDVPSGIGDISINDFETSSVDPSKLFTVYSGAGFAAGGGLFCYDGSGSPTGDCAGLPNRPFYRVHAYDNLVLVAGGHVFGSETAGVYSSGDDGASWSLEDNGWVNLYAHEAIRLDNGSLVAASYRHGIMTAGGPGMAWSPVEQYDGFSFKSILQTASGRLLAGMEVLGVFAKDPDGDWTESSSGIRMITINDAYIDPDSSGRILGVSSGLNTGMALFTPGGVDEWAVIRSLPNPRYSAAYISPSGRWYVAMDGPISHDQDGVYVSADEGTSFDFIGPLDGAHMDHHILDIHERGDGEEIFVAGTHFSTFTPLIMHSSDSGGTWEPLYESEEICHVARISESGDSLLVPLDCEGGGIVRVAPDMTAELLQVTPSHSGAVDACGCRTDGQTIYAIGRDDPDDILSRALFVTGDGGGTWNAIEIGIDMGTFLRVAVHPLLCDLVFVAGTEGAVFSDDGGGTWTFLDGSDGLRMISKMRAIYTTGYDAVLVLAGEGGVMAADLIGEAL